MLVDKLLRLGGWFAAIAVAARHVHLLIQLPPHLTRQWVGQLKRHVTFTLREQGWSGTLWAGQAKYVPIRDRPHQLNAYQYIIAHVKEGAAVATRFLSGFAMPAGFSRR
jgi:REP element-mobilizing transposase RayT